MKIKAVLFDLDGTLHNMTPKIFDKLYFGGLVNALTPHGYEKDKLLESIFVGVKAMKSNDGSRTNMDVFWDAMYQIYGQKILDDKPIFDKFYETDYDKVKESCSPIPFAPALVSSVKSMGIKVAITTNPLFPAIALLKRVEWAGLNPDIFEFVTTYENSYHAKPNPEYFRDAINALGVKPEECIMVGNDVYDDMPAAEIGINVFLINDHNLINRENKDISKYPQGTLDDFLDYLYSFE